ncbi:uncharacterized protein LOC105279061 isoform X2 [Ooceraea biroi]|uniref:uncharacterized protein LOC105279061 isoform X2 n=1 Tax=Ooceraea biroi TaxID=2015173 RepID=UPI0005B8BD5D|nr:uncharacterized protein LOC105279061 isoform X2 [Ooceraea biroi]
MPCGHLTNSPHASVVKLMFHGTWHWWSVLLLLLLATRLLSVYSQCGSYTRQERQENQDEQSKLALYKVSLRTYWSRARFPRHYPEWKPPAQFGKLFGRTHDSSYILYRLSEKLSPGAQLYVETGRVDELDTDGDPNILHSFIGAPVLRGEGTSVTRVFLDSNHTLISIMARINPSPDWFVGVDSFQLCVDGNWVDTVTVELDPFDGGTDNGFTFTATNWPTQPKGIVYRITSRYPAHPAGSFYYPNLLRLPPIATLTFTKLHEYTLTESCHENNIEVKFINKLQANSATPRGIDPNKYINKDIAKKWRKMDSQRYRYWDSTGNSQEIIDIPQNNKAIIINSIASSYALQRPRYLATSKLVTGSNKRYSETGKFGWPYYQAYKQTAKTQKAQFYNDIQRKIVNASNMSNIGYSFLNNATSLTDQREHRLRVKHHGLISKGKRIRTHAPRDCKISEWGPWSACSRSCGVGETQRMRKITIKPRRSGASCPPLKETKWCGSANPCSESKPINYHW